MTNWETFYLSPKKHWETIEIITVLQNGSLTKVKGGCAGAPKAADVKNEQA